MATITDILQKEGERQPNEVRLFKEGMFWRAYEQSAYLLATREELKPLKKYIKAIDRMVAYVGFPESSWQKFTGTEQPPQEQTTTILAKETDTSGFEDWKAQIKTQEQLAQEKEHPRKQRDEKPGRELPIYRVGYDLLKYFVTVSRKMPRDYKYGIGEKVQEGLMRIAVLTRKAQQAKQKEQKAEYVEQAITQRIETELYIRLLYDCKAIGLKQYTLMAEQIVELEKHLINWQQYINKQ